MDAASWPARVRAARRRLPRLAAVELQADGADPRRTAFLLKLAAAEIRARIASRADRARWRGGGRCRRDAVVTADVAPSIDAIALPPGADPIAAAAWIAAHDPGAMLVLGDVALPGSGAARAFVDARAGAPRHAGGHAWLRLTARAMREVLAVASRLRDLYAGDVAPVSTTRGRVSVREAGAST